MDIARDRFAHKHFLAQDERPRQVEAVPVEKLDPFLRSLLFTDGTVTSALEVRALAPVAVERVAQVEMAVPAEVARDLEVDPGEPSIRRRVRIGFESEAPLLWAESYLIPERLPPGFMGLLDGAPDGIGQSLQRVALESCRELLWFGLDRPPEWAGAGEAVEGSTVRRLYRILSGGQSSILISESFAVRDRAGTLHLAAPGGYVVEPALSEVAR